MLAGKSSNAAGHGGGIRATGGSGSQGGAQRIRQGCLQEGRRRGAAPAQNNLAYVVDDETLAPVPIGVPGELLLGGVQIARGYHNRRELTAAKFVRNPFGEGRVYKTGDRVQWSGEGELRSRQDIRRQAVARKSSNADSPSPPPLRSPSHGLHAF